MRRLQLLSVLILTSMVGPAIADVNPPKGFTALFNGKDTAGWHGMPHTDPYALSALPEEEQKKRRAGWTTDALKHWTVEKDELVNDGHGAYLTTDREYGDIELLIEYRTVPLADSGIYLRCTPQIQIWDTTKEGGKWNLGADKGSGGLWNNEPGSPGRDPLVHADKPFGEWNRMRIVQVGERVTVHLNDKLVVDHAQLRNFWRPNEPLMKKGRIQLQTHGKEIRWRNIFIREIPPAEATAILAKHESQAFQSVFNGKNLDGWQGAVNDYEVVDGAIVCKPKRGGNLYTVNQFGDFVVRVEYRLPAGGNNGLAIRYPGKGQPSSEAMCEVQILDDGAAKYAKLDSRQYNGSVYGMIAARRGYDHPVGEWNLMEVTVHGPKIQVELNGSRIVNGDVSKVTEFMGNKAHPGKDLLTGYFGFAGHSDPVAFRSVKIKELKSKK